MEIISCIVLQVAINCLVEFYELLSKSTKDDMHSRLQLFLLLIFSNIGQLNNTWISSSIIFTFLV